MWFRRLRIAILPFVVAVITAGPVAASPCYRAFARLFHTPSLNKIWSRHLPDAPYPEEIHSWAKALLTPDGQASHPLILDPAFNDAFHGVAHRAIDESRNPPEAKAQLREAFDSWVTNLKMQAARENRSPPAEPMEPDAREARKKTYEQALTAYFHSERFRKVWRLNLPLLPDIDHIDEQLDKLTRRYEDLDHNAFKALADGKSPLLVSENSRNLFQAVARAAIEQANISEEKKEQLQDRLAEGILAMEKQAELLLPQSRKPPERAGSRTEAKPLSEKDRERFKSELETYLNSEKFKNCLWRASRVTAISTAISSAFQGVANWSHLDEKETQLEIGTRLTWNLLLTASISGLACVNTDFLTGNSRIAQKVLTPDNINGLILSPVATTVAQFVIAHRFDLSHFILNTLWVRTISVYKNRVANKTTEWYQRNGYPRPALFDMFVVQFASELLGAAGYTFFDWYAMPAIQNSLPAGISSWLFPGFDDDKKKKKQDSEGPTE